MPTLHQPARRSRPVIGLGALSLASALACVDEPPRAVDLHALTVIATHVEVVASGQLSVPTTVDGRTRAELLPGDLVRLSAVYADSRGLVDGDAVDVTWYACGPYDCFANLELGYGVPDCPAAAYIGAPGVCRLGRGAAIEFLFAPPFQVEMLEPLAALRVLVVARDPTISARSCEERLEWPSEDIGDCAIHERFIELGPKAAIIDALGEQGLLDPTLYPTSLWSVEVNLNPVVREFAIDPIGRGAEERVPARGRVTLAPGETVSIEPVIDERDLQMYFDSENAVGTESAYWRWFVTDPDFVETPPELPSDPLLVSAPARGGETMVFVRVEDTREGEVGEWLTVAVEER